MMMTSKALKLYLAIEHLGAGQLAERSLRDAARLSHGSFIAARKELRQMKLLDIEQIHRKPHYSLLNPELAAKAIAETAAMDKDHA
ncbi:hypothetical protein [Mitsuokella sp.]|uniref:hypothetical protein n=1 Tax=Mitsuokella sp. TaxID=2049034 RepID=UPI003D7DFDD0